MTTGAAAYTLTQPHEAAMTDDDRRGWFWDCDPDDPVDRMVMDIASGVAKVDSDAVTTDRLSALWDRMEPEITAAIARGEEIVCDSGT